VALAIAATGSAAVWFVIDEAMHTAIVEF
jgi:hypothetical protein